GNERVSNSTSALSTMPFSSSAQSRCQLSPRGSTASLPKTAEVLTRIWSEQAAVAGGADAGSSTSQREETRSAYVSMVALVGPNCSPSRRSHDSVDSAMVIARASEPAL